MDQYPLSAVEAELLTNRFSAIAREMGAMLERTALSTNVKERRDFSCGILDGEGNLLVNAPHIPVHLGALGLCVRRLLETVEMRRGDVIVTNHPAFGGSHLPDVTVVSPVFATGREESRRPAAFVASRAHHAEIGGIRPGSMPPSATRLDEEGVVIPPSVLIREGRARWEEVESLLRNARHPSRAIEENLIDLEAAVAANHRGRQAISALLERETPSRVVAAMARLKARAESRMRAALLALPDGVLSAQENLDDGAPLRVRIEISGDSARIDFTGTGPVHPGNLNATPAIVQSAVIYVLRVLVNEPLPLNEGLLAPVELVIPQGTLLNPDFSREPAPAVVGGNVETSQRLVDTLLKALEVAACSQGTMNNTLFGNTRFGYYETIAGGAGAVPGHPGANAVHTHMTNTRMTDPEVLERRYPVRVEQYSVRRGSGGAGRWRGGDGVERRIRFLQPVSVSLLAQHRATGPYGVDGGLPGAPGRQRLERAGGEVLELGAVDGCEAAQGDLLCIETPGGGGWGVPAQ